MAEPVGLWATQWRHIEAMQAVCFLPAGLKDQLLCKPTGGLTSPCGPCDCGLAYPEEVAQVQGGLLAGAWNLSAGASPVHKP